MSDLVVCKSYVPLGYVSLISLFLCLVLFAMFDLLGCFVTIKIDFNWENLLLQ